MPMCVYACVYMLSCTHSDHLATHHKTETLCETVDQIHQSWTSAWRTREHQTLWSERKAKQNFVKLSQMLKSVTRNKCLKAHCFLFWMEMRLNKNLI